jgi:hypothetical protein
MIKQRGGMRGLRASNQFLEKVLYWYVSSFGPTSFGPVPDRLCQG